eukprot:103212-Pelagomonas_calceolata.AAC.1
MTLKLYKHITCNIVLTSQTIRVHPARGERAAIGCHLRSPEVMCRHGGRGKAPEHLGNYHAKWAPEVT